MTIPSEVRPAAFKSPQLFSPFPPLFYCLPAVSINPSFSIFRRFAFWAEDSAARRWRHWLSQARSPSTHSATDSSDWCCASASSPGVSSPVATILYSIGAPSSSCAATKTYFLSPGLMTWRGSDPKISAAGQDWQTWCWAHPTTCRFPKNPGTSESPYTCDWSKPAAGYRCFDDWSRGVGCYSPSYPHGHSGTPNSPHAGPSESNFRMSLEKDWTRSTDSWACLPRHPGYQTSAASRRSRKTAYPEIGAASAGSGGYRLCCSSWDFRL